MNQRLRIIWKIHESVEESTVLSVKQKTEKESRWDTALRTLESAHVKPLKLCHMEARSFPDTFFATLPDWAGRLRLNCPPLRRVWSGHVLSLGIIRTYQLQCSPLLACHLHQAGYCRTDLRPPRRWERCEDREKRGRGEQTESEWDRDTWRKLARYRGGRENWVFLYCVVASGQRRTDDGQNSFPGFFLSCLNLRGGTAEKLHEAKLFANPAADFGVLFMLGWIPCGQQIGHVYLFICTFCFFFTVQKETMWKVDGTCVGLHFACNSFAINS